MRQPRIALALALAASAAATVAAAAGCDVTKGKYFGRITRHDHPEILYYGNSADPEFLDPSRLTAVNDAKVSDQMFEGLTELHPETARPIPALADRWTVSPDWLDFSFHIRDDAKFSDGRPLTADDVIYNWARTLHPLWAARDAEEMYKIEGAEEYNAGKLRRLLRPVGHLAAGRVLVLDQVAPAQSPAQKQKDGPDDANLRRARAGEIALLRADPRDDAPVLHRFGHGDDLTIFTTSPDGAWDHVWEGSSLAGGWVRDRDLEAPYADHVYLVEGFDQKGVREYVRGRELLMDPSVLALKAPDPHTLTMHLAKPTLYWLTQVANSTFRVSDHYSVDRGGASWHRYPGFACSGAFCMTEWKLRNRITMVKNPLYWDAARVTFDKIVVLSIEKQATAINVYFAGDVDVLTANSIPGSMLPVVNGGLGQPPKADYLRLPWLGTYFYVVNVDQKKGPPELKNRHLRRALALSLDRAELPGILRSGVLPWAAMVPDGMEAVVGYKSPPGLRYDLAAAQQELAAAKQELGSIPTLTIRLNQGVEAHQIIAEWVQAQWKQHLGLDITLELQEFGTMLKAMREHDFQIMRMGGIGSMPEPEDFVGDNYRKGNPNNKPGWDSDEYMALLDKMQGEPNRDKRNAYIYQMENLVLEDAVVIPLVLYVQHHLTKPYLCGSPHNLLDQTAMKYMWIDFTQKCDRARPKIVEAPE